MFRILRTICDHALWLADFCHVTLRHAAARRRAHKRHFVQSHQSYPIHSLSRLKSGNYNLCEAFRSLNIKFTIPKGSRQLKSIYKPVPSTTSWPQAFRRESSKSVESIQSRDQVVYTKSSSASSEGDAARELYKGDKATRRRTSQKTGKTDSLWQVNRVIPFRIVTAAAPFRVVHQRARSCPNPAAAVTNKDLVQTPEKFIGRVAFAMPVFYIFLSQGRPVHTARLFFIVPNSENPARRNKSQRSRRRRTRSSKFITHEMGVGKEGVEKIPCFFVRIDNAPRKSHLHSHGLPSNNSSDGSSPTAGSSATHKKRRAYWKRPKNRSKAKLSAIEQALARVETQRK